MGRRGQKPSAVPDEDDVVDGVVRWPVKENADRTTKLERTGYVTDSIVEIGIRHAQVQMAQGK